MSGLLAAAGINAINDAVFEGFGRTHVVVAVGVARNDIERLAGAFGKNAVQKSLQVLNLALPPEG